MRLWLWNSTAKVALDNVVHRNMFQLVLLYFSLFVCSVLSSHPTQTLRCKLETEAVKKFREYIRIDTSRSENLPKAVQFWKHQAKEYGLKFAVYEPAGKPICVLTWKGANTSLPTIMLNSHMDVVPADQVDWKYPPFAADVDADGNIYGRGTQDTKDIAIQYLAAIGKMIREGIILQRTIHITLVPDEETGGFNGMIPFLKSPQFDALNVGFALDEGLPANNEHFYATYQDRRPWQMKFTVRGEAGHGFIMPTDAAILKLQKLLDVMLKYRKPLQKAVKGLKNIDYGLYTTLNINVIQGGATPNVIPQNFTVVADMRLSPKENATKIQSLVNSWVAHAGEGTTVEYIRQVMDSLPTAVDGTNPYWVAIKEAMNQLGYNILPIVCPATSDMVPVRNRGLPALGFAPARRTASRAHANNEYLNVDVFLDGIEIYVALIKKLGNLPGK